LPLLFPSRSRQSVDHRPRSPARGRTRLGWAGGLLWGWVGLSGCATTGSDLSQPAELAKESLRADDCPLATLAYRQRLQLPPNAGVVVSHRSPAPRSVEEQETRAALFSMQCQGQVGKARRAILRCWLDALDESSFLACNDRF
jgi:hypothetical protein